MKEVANGNLEQYRTSAKKNGTQCYAGGLSGNEEYDIWEHTGI